MAFSLERLGDNMGKMICDDRKSPEEYRKEREFIQSMSDKEFDDYIKKMKEKEKNNKKTVE